MGLDSVGFEASRRVMILGTLSSFWTQHRRRNISDLLLGIDWMFLNRGSMDLDAPKGLYKYRTNGVTIMVIPREDNTSWVKHWSSMACN